MEISEDHVAEYENSIDVFLGEELEAFFSAKTVGPLARKQLRHLLRYYAKFKHPFTKCVRDNRKRFGPLTERICAVIKDLIVGHTKWRKGRKKASLSEDEIAFIELMDSDDVPEVGEELLEFLEHLSEEDSWRLNEIYNEAASMSDDTPDAVEVLFSSKDAGIEDRLGDKKVIWKDILSEGVIQIAPVPGMRKRPFTVIPDGKTDVKNLVVSMADIKKAFEDRAFKYVKIPAEHPKDKSDIVLKNTGFIEGLRIVKKRGKHYLQGAHDFTEPDIKGKVLRGTIPDVSSGILLGYTRSHDRKQFPAALHHVALTGDPIIPDLDPFERSKQAFASDDDINLSDNLNIISVEFAEDEASDDKADVIWNEQDGSNWVKQALETSLAPKQAASEALPAVPQASFYVIDVSQTKNLALVDMFFKGKRSRWVVPFTISDGEAKPAPEIRWTEGREALIAASDDVPFEKYSVSQIKDKIELAIRDLFGEDAKNYKVKEVSLDNRVQISDGKGNIFLADFVIDNNEQVFLSEHTEWKELPAASKTITIRSNSVSGNGNTSNVINIYDESTPEGRVMAHRARLRSAISNANRTRG